MPDRDQDAPKIIVDSDWKSQAQAEKERLAEEEAAREQQAGAPGAPGPGGLPPADFNGLVGMLATQAVMYMGAMADKTSGQAIFDPEYSKHMIDLLGVLEEKTKGNLTDDEARDLQQILHELRSRFVELARVVAEQGAARPPGATPPPPGQPPMPGA
jgi:hypothetical protein